MCRHQSSPIGPKCGFVSWADEVLGLVGAAAETKPSKLPEAQVALPSDSDEGDDSDGRAHSGSTTSILQTQPKSSSEAAVLGSAHTPSVSSTSSKGPGVLSPSTEILNKMRVKFAADKKERETAERMRLEARHAGSSRAQHESSQEIAQDLVGLKTEGAGRKRAWVDQSSKHGGMSEGMGDLSTTEEEDNTGDILLSWLPKKDRQEKPTVACKYGDNCYQKNVSHLLSFGHSKSLLRSRLPVSLVPCTIRLRPPYHPSSCMPRMRRNCVDRLDHIGLRLGRTRVALNRLGGGLVGGGTIG